MQLHYNILWVDNDIDDYLQTGDVESISKFLVELGFEPTIVTVDDEANLDEFILLHKYDLIISDFQLNATTGDVIIEKIRNEKRFSTEILFYSAKTNFREDPEVKNRLAFIDRVTFHTGRDTFLDKIEKVVELSLDKLLELNATRGLITSATSELDVEIQRAVYHLVETNGIDEDSLKELISKKDYDSLTKKHKNYWDNYVDFVSQYPKLDAVKKWEILRDLLKPYKKDSNDIDSFLKQNKSYQEQVIGIRNKFAHAKEEVVEGKQVLKGQFGNDFEFDKDACVQIRKDITEHRNNFRALFKYFGI